MHTNRESHPAGRRMRRTLPTLAGLALTGALAAGTALVSSGALSAKAPTAGNPVAATIVPADFTSVIERVSPAVVNVEVTGRAETGEVQQLPKGMEEFFRRFFGENFPGLPQQPDQGPRAPRVKGMGSGFIIDPDGLIVTNHHVVAEADVITVTLQDRRQFEAKLVGSDEETDLALIKIDAGNDLPYVSFSDGPTPRPGQWVIAVGNPFGLDHTATAGIVSATGRAIGAGPYDDFIQIDASINRGNSGGPLFNLAGEVVGVNTAIFSPTGGNIGIGFAIPTSTARTVIDQLRTKGHVERGWLGVEIQEVSPDIAEGLGLDRPSGALVSRVMEDGPAQRAGLKAGDLILALNDKKVDRIFTLTRAVAALPPGETVTLTVRRNGEEETLSVRLGTRPASGEVASAGPRGEDQASLGLGLAPDRDGEGVAVVAVDPDGPAAAQGIRPGDVIVSVAGDAVQSPAEVAEKVAAARKAGRKSVLMLIERDGQRRFVALPLSNA